MANRSALDTLIELAQRDTDDAAKRLGHAIAAQGEAEKKLAMLLDYRQDYAVRLQEQQVAGMTPMAYRNFVAFVDKLDNAINGQREVLKHAQHRVGVDTGLWQGCERKRLSYRTLDQRAAEQALKLENKRDQKQTDEHATRQAHYKR